MNTIVHAVLGDRDVSVDLNIEDAAEVTPELLGRAAQFVTRLADFDATALAALRQSYDGESGPAVTIYVSHHLEEVSAEALTEIFGKPKKSLAVHDFLARLILKRVWLHLSKSDGYATLDYTTGADVTQYILAVRIDEEGEVLGVEMES